MRKISTLITRLTVLSIVFFGFNFSASASHYAGSDLYYECLGGNQYKVTLVFYRDCIGIDEPGEASIVLTNLCTNGTTSTIIFKKPDGNGFVNGEEITSTCLGVSSACNGGTAPGLRKWVYEGTVTVTSGCSDWKLSYELCCRNGAITTLQSGSSESLYTEATFNSSICDHAPQFSNNPIAFACVNQPFNFNQGAFDADGDVLTYELDDPLSTGGVPVAFAAGFSKTAPFAVSAPFTLNAATGGVSFTPNALQVGVVAVKVKQFRNGVLIGYVRRDMEIFVTNCNNNTLPQASGFNGTSNYSVNVCAGQQICATINTSDADAGQIVTPTWNAGIGGANFVVGSGNTPTATVCWTPTEADVASNPNVFTVTVKDDACPTNGQQTFTYVINVIAKPVITFSTINETCGGDNGSATANTGSNSSLLWSTGSTNATITGLPAGTYTVTVTNSNGCVNSASTTVGSSNGTIALSGSANQDNGTCNGSIDLNINSGSAPYTISWSNGATTEDIGGLCSGNYTVNITDANGCAGITTINVSLLTTGCKISMSVKSNDEGYCKIGGIVTGNAIGMSGKGTAVLTNSGGVVVATKIFAKQFIFDGLHSDTYTVIVTDAAGCTATATAYVGNGNCGAPVNVQATNITSKSALIKWDNCGAKKHVVRYKVNGNKSFSYLTVTNVNQALLTNLQSNTKYSVRVKAVCSGKSTQFSAPVLFCTGGCVVPKFADETELLDDNNQLIVSFAVTPNPSSEYISIVGESNFNKSTKVVFTNILGKVVMTKDIDLTGDVFDRSLNISELPQGVYIISIQGFENISQRFVKM